MKNYTKKAVEWYEKYHKDVKNSTHFLDRITPFYLRICEKLPPAEQELLYYLSLSENKLNVDFLKKKTNQDSKVVSAYLNSLYVKGIIHKEKNGKNNLYFIDDIVFKKWANMRWNFKTDVKGR